MTMILETNSQYEFEFIKPFLQGKGIDVGCGTSRLSPDILALDQQPDQRYAHADVVHDCKDLEVGKPFEFKGQMYDFRDNEFDFIFSSHCLEDFPDIDPVFLSWWKKIKANGLMILLLPDMQGGRYPDLKMHRETGQGNPSHKTDVGKEFIFSMLERLKLNYEIIQADTIPHDRSCTIDFVIKKKD